jgi:hypothetical protein
MAFVRQTISKESVYPIFVGRLSDFCPIFGEPNTRGGAHTIQSAANPSSHKQSVARSRPQTVMSAPPYNSTPYSSASPSSRQTPIGSYASPAYARATSTAGASTSSASVPAYGAAPPPHHDYGSHATRPHSAQVLGETSYRSAHSAQLQAAVSMRPASSPYPNAQTGSRFDGKQSVMTQKRQCKEGEVNRLHSKVGEEGGRSGASVGGGGCVRSSRCAVWSVSPLYTVCESLNRSRSEGTLCSCYSHLRTEPLAYVHLVCASPHYLPHLTNTRVRSHHRNSHV